MIRIGIRIANLVQNVPISNYYALLLYFSQKEEKQEEAKTEKEKNKETKPALFFIC